MSINPFALPQHSNTTTSYLYPTTANMFQQTEHPVYYSTTGQRVTFNSGAVSPPPSYNQIVNNNENEEANKELNQKRPKSSS